MGKYRNKYRIPSARIQNWDYGTDGAYFITICTENRHYFFGDIATNSAIDISVDTSNSISSHAKPILIPTELGKLAEQFWLEIPNQFSFIELGEFVIMPNHIHGILIINKVNLPLFDASNLSFRMPLNGGVAGNNNPMFQQNIARVIRWYKGRCSFEMRKINEDFKWQSRYYEHLIRDDLSFERISSYIINNPTKWAEDKFFDSEISQNL
jgi:REP element-mobilizing transposase RayT